MMYLVYSTTLEYRAWLDDHALERARLGTRALYLRRFGDKPTFLRQTLTADQNYIVERLGQPTPRRILRRMQSEIE
jgi:hypothetical protein